MSGQPEMAEPPVVTEPQPDESKKAGPVQEPEPVSEEKQAEEEAVQPPQESALPDFCTNCGAKFEDAEQMFCSNCGKKRGE